MADPRRCLSQSENQIPETPGGGRASRDVEYAFDAAHMWMELLYAQLAVSAASAR
jgi:hypothetical protein